MHFTAPGVDGPQVSETSLDNYAYCYYTVQNAHLFSQLAHNDNKPKKEAPQQVA